MWPFSRPKPEPHEQSASMSDLGEVLRRIRELERGLEDLHAAYRRIRAASGGDGRAAAARALPGGSAGEPIDKKAALRAKAREMSIARRGDG